MNGQQLPGDDQVRRYLKSRAQVDPPPDLIYQALASRPARRPGASFGFVGLAAAVGGVLVLGLVIVLAGGALLGPGRSPAPVAQTAPPPSGALRPDGVFPTSVAGMPVVSVSQALDLLHSGALSGRAVAAAGYFAQFPPSCPNPMRQIGPLEDWCRLVAFTDVEASARLCVPYGDNGVSCSEPSGPSLSPLFMAESSGSQSTQLSPRGDPIPLVVIGHANDPRQWQCASDKRAECAAAFVVDRVAWADGQDVPLSAPQTGRQISASIITPRMTLNAVIANLRPAAEVLTGAPFDAGGIATVDPRFNMAGDDLVWIVRSLAPTGDSSDPTRAETVSLVDDATGSVLETRDLAMPADYKPARLWTQAIAPFECCPGDQPFPFYSVKAGGQTLHDGMVDGGATGRSDGSTQFGPGTPVVLDAGEYEMTAWLSALSPSGPTGSPTEPCVAGVVLRGDHDGYMQVTFAKDGSCMWDVAPLPTPSP